MLAQQKDILENVTDKNESQTNDSNSNSEMSTLQASDTSEEIFTNIPNGESNRICYASVCRLLQAKGIIRHFMICTKGRNTCSGCSQELARHRKIIQLEKELQAIAVDNDKLAPLLQYRTKLISIKVFRSALAFLPTFNSKTRDDYIFRAARYVANTLGILIQNTPSSNLIDPPMTSTEKRQAWRKANFLCKCLDNATVTNCGIRSFCNLCSYIIPCMNLMQSTKCPGCNTFDSWEHIGFLCLACQFANMTFQNPFVK